MHLFDFTIEIYHHARPYARVIYTHSCTKVAYFTLFGFVNQKYLMKRDKRYVTLYALEMRHIRTESTRGM